MNRRRRSIPCTCLVAAAIIAAQVAASSSIAADRDRFELIDSPPPRPAVTRPAATRAAADVETGDTPVSRALILLNTEARQLAKDGRIEIRGKPDFAQRKGLRVGSAEILRVMGTQLHRDPVLDAYVKWQLLSFQPDLEGAPGEQIDRVLNNAPGLMLTPQLGADVERTYGRAGGLQVEAGVRTTRQRTIVLGWEPVPGSKTLKPKVAVVREGVSARAGGVSMSGTSVERHGGPDLEVSRQDLIDIRERAAAVNVQVCAFRDALIAQLPARRGVRLSAMMHDLADRIRAGDRSVDHASQALVAQLRKEAKTDALDGSVRRALADQLVDLAAMRVEVIRAMSHGDDKGIDFDTTVVQMPRGDVRSAMDVLDKAEHAPAKPAGASKRDEPARP